MQSKAILGKLFDVEKDALGVEHYITYKYHYQSVKEQFPGLSQEEFKEQVSLLYKQGFVSVDVKDSGNSIIDGSIEITHEGLEYYLNNMNKRKIGF